MEWLGSCPLPMTHWNYSKRTSSSGTFDPSLNMRSSPETLAHRRPTSCDHRLSASSILGCSVLKLTSLNRLPSGNVATQSPSRRALGVPGLMASALRSHPSTSGHARLDLFSSESSRTSMRRNLRHGLSVFIACLILEITGPSCLGARLLRDQLRSGALTSYLAKHIFHQIIFLIHFDYHSNSFLFLLHT